MESRVAIPLVCKVSGDTQRAEEGLARAEPGVGSGGKDLRARPFLTARWIESPRPVAPGSANSSVTSGSGQQKSSRPPLL